MPAEPTSAPIAPPSRRTSILPAAVVLLTAIAVLGLFVIVDVTTSSNTTTTTMPLVENNGLRPLAHAKFFAGDVTEGVPPRDVASALLVPVGTTYLGTVTTGGNSFTNYDVEVRLSVRAPRADLLGFYEANLHALGWSLFSSSGAADDADELLFQRSGSDGNYWETGVVANPTSGGRTAYELRLFVVDSDMSSRSPLAGESQVASPSRVKSQDHTRKLTGYTT